MKKMLVLLALLLWALPVFADTYSWVDDQGTYNFADELSLVPKKYRKKAKRTSEIDSEPTQVKAAPAAGGKPADNAGSAVGKQAGETKNGAAPGNIQLYAGKTSDAWKAELGQHEAELDRIEQQAEQIRTKLNSAGAAAGVDRSKMMAEYDSLRASYKQKSSVYNNLLEAARKAGLVIEMKK